MNIKIKIITLLNLLLIVGCSGAAPEPIADDEGAIGNPAVHENVLLNLWGENHTAFGIYVPSSAQGGRAEDMQGEKPFALGYSVEAGQQISENPLYDFAFLNLEGRYDGDAVRVIMEGIRSPNAVGRKSVLVRIPSVEEAGIETTAERITEIMEAGADGVTIPHVRNLEEAETVAGLFRELDVDVWSPANPEGEKIAMIMLEDPEAIAQASQIADVEGISILACGIGSLTGAVARARNPELTEGRPQVTAEDRAVAEAMNMKVLEESKRVGVADMITANAENIERRVQEGFLALLMSGPDADTTIELGRTAAGRQ